MLRISIIEYEANSDDEVCDECGNSPTYFRVPKRFGTPFLCPNCLESGSYLVTKGKMVKLLLKLMLGQKISSV